MVMSNHTNKKGSSFTKNTKKTAIILTNKKGFSFTKNTKKTAISHTYKKGSSFTIKKQYENSN